MTKYSVCFILELYNPQNISIRSTVFVGKVMFLLIIAIYLSLAVY